MSYRIAEVARMVGVPTTTLRYYEDIDLVAKPARDQNGYRRYGDADVARLRFAANAKDLGIPLDDVRQLVAAYEADDCSRVAHQVAELVATRMAQTQSRIGEMTTLVGQLQTVADRLAGAPSGQACGDGCPCATTSLDAAVTPRRQLPRVKRPDLSAVPIACTLHADAVPDRMGDWDVLLSSVTGRAAIDGGVAVTFPAEADLVGRVAALAVAEQSCCAFFDFTIHITSSAVRLEVRAPADAADAVTVIFGRRPSHRRRRSADRVVAGAPGPPASCPSVDRGAAGCGGGCAC